MGFNSGFKGLNLSKYLRHNFHTYIQGISW